MILGQTSIDLIKLSSPSSLDLSHGAAELAAAIQDPSTSIRAPDCTQAHLHNTYWQEVHTTHPDSNVIGGIPEQ